MLVTYCLHIFNLLYLEYYKIPVRSDKYIYAQLASDTCLMKAGLGAGLSTIRLKECFLMRFFMLGDEQQIFTVLTTNGPCVIIKALLRSVSTCLELYTGAAHSHAVLIASAHSIKTS